MCRETICLPATPVERARALVGTRFRLHGRDPSTGLDCVGLMGAACERRDLPTGYALRGGSGAGWATLIDGFALRRGGDAQAGDILLMRAGPAQFHLGLWSGTSLIHADAGLGRVVELPGALPWPVVGVWHINQKGA